MAIYYALIQTTLVPEWDNMFKRQFSLIQKYGKRQYIHTDVETMEQRKEQQDQKRGPHQEMGKGMLSDHGPHGMMQRHAVHPSRAVHGRPNGMSDNEHSA